MKYFFLLIFFLLLLTQSSFAETILPMMPVYKSSGLKKKFVGVRILWNDIVSADSSKQAAHSQLRALGLYTYPSLDYVDMSRDFKNSGILGTLKYYSKIQSSRSTCIGLCLRFGSAGEDTLVVGEEYTYGFKMNIAGFRSGDIRDKHGVWISDPLTQIVEEGGFLIHGDTAMDIALKTARYGNFLLKSQNRDAQSVDWPRSQFPDLVETPRKSVSVNSQAAPRKLPLKFLAP